MYFVQVISTFGLDTYIGINYFEHKNDRQRLREFTGTVLMILTAIGTLVSILMLIGGNAIFSLVFSETAAMEFFPFGMITVVSAVFNGIFKSYSSLLINQQRPERFFWINISNFVLTLGASLVLLYLFPFTLWGPVAGRLIPAVVIGSVATLMILAESGLRFRKDFLHGVWSFCAPMVVYAIMVWVVKVTLGIDLVQVGLANTIHPKVYNIWKDGNLRESTTEVNRYYNGLTAVTLLVIPVIVIVIPLVVPLLIRKEIYYTAFVFLPMLCLGFATRPWYYLFLAPLFYFKKTKVLPKVLFLSALFQVVVCSLLVWKFGMVGAVWSNFLVKPVQAFFLWTESRKIFTFRLNYRKIFVLPLIFIVSVIASQFFVTRGNVVIFGFAYLLLAGILVWLTYRKELVQLLPGRFRS
jgi:O-antigen/teichoic acid export membrane protein